jgi:hypothetical protein
MRCLKDLIRLVQFLLSLSPIYRAELLAWVRREFSDQSPHFIKLKILDTARDVDLWVETGTYMGDTTLYLGKNLCQVVSFEPSKELAEAATQRFFAHPNIRIVNSQSEDRLDAILTDVSPATNHLAFWLDGHFSEGTTYRGSKETPIVSELEAIAKHNSSFRKITIFIDDFRCFVKGMTDYPAPGFLTIWAENNGFEWNVQHDIFIMRKISK